MVSRYFLIIRRRTAVRHMKKRQAELNDSGADRAVEIPADTRLDFAEIGSQLHRLLRGGVVVTILMGLSFIWADMVPALKILERVTVWETSITVTQESTSIDGTPIATPHTKVVPVTLADVLLGCLMMAATIAGTRNLPGLLNITVFEKLPIDHGARYALTLVTRYLTTLVGMAIAFHWIGISWQSVQWLVAAMTVGLGFGLQEIFANFVSGLIILTERPIRIGDIVTVGGITGKVTRMQMRATTITDFDRRELVVPNKKFITEDVVNWTLSDPVTRIVLPVGIAYDCDPQAARDQLLELAKAHPLILKDPEPTAIFTGFGDSTLNLELRAFIVGRDAFAQIQDELNLAINKSFRTAGIEIAYPQRDLHIRSVHPAAMQFSTLAAAPPAANPSPASQSNPDRLRLGEPHLDAA
jgi:potassium efflux system protein